MVLPDSGHWFCQRRYFRRLLANLPLFKGSSIIGVFWGRFTEQEPKINAENTTKLFQLLQKGELKPHISKIYPLEQSAMALEVLEKRRAKGKVIINI